MANETQDPNQIFTPFTPSPPTDPAQPASQPPQVKRKKKAAAKQRTVAPVNPPAEQATPASKKERKKRAVPKPRVAKAKRAPKYDLQTILRVASTLKDADSKAFEKMLGELSALPKGSRGRVLAALAEVFG